MFISPVGVHTQFSSGPPFFSHSTREKFSRPDVACNQRIGEICVLWPYVGWPSPVRKRSLSFSLFSVPSCDTASFSPGSPIEREVAASMYQLRVASLLKNNGKPVMRGE